MTQRDEKGKMAPNLSIKALKQEVLAMTDASLSLPWTRKMAGLEHLSKR